MHRQISRTRCECIMGHKILSNAMMCSIAYIMIISFFVRLFRCCHWFARAVLISFQHSQHSETNIPFVIDGERGSMKNRYGYNWYERLKCWSMENEKWVRCEGFIVNSINYAPLIHSSAKYLMRYFCLLHFHSALHAAPSTRTFATQFQRKTTALQRTNTHSPHFAK